MPRGAAARLLSAGLPALAKAAAPTPKQADGGGAGDVLIALGMIALVAVLVSAVVWAYRDDRCTVCRRRPATILGKYCATCWTRPAGDRKPTRPHGVGPRSLPRQTPNVADVLRPLLNRPDVLVIDVETTGLGERAEVLAVAVIDTTGRVLLDTVSLPQGQGPIPRGASDVNGLPRAKLRSMGARPWPAVHVELRPLLFGAHAALAWNADFDRRLLEQTAERHGLTLPPVVWHCAMKAEATTRDDLYDDDPYDRAPWVKLTEAAARLRVPAPVAHNALADVRTTLAVVRALVGDNPA